ncbi:hypothetical protein LWI29_010684 [Acer saccharum]|uniref:Isopenicillin N synthase-like Fe(2+) 2OG dioxygenase domain-containing protein n=1 Tax=Acer saccharum TaxID=4024 RepID=A0AA39SSD5_ACESA|nr:hypothetical protein LWI29_010684 [Acer saccharum]
MYGDQSQTFITWDDCQIMISKTELTMSCIDIYIRGVLYEQLKEDDMLGQFALINPASVSVAGGGPMLGGENLSGEWISAPPIPGAFVCNIGDMLKLFSNGLYESTVHRVINNSPKYRVCVAYFYETNFDAAVEPLDFCVERTGGTAKFGRAVNDSI